MKIKLSLFLYLFLMLPFISCYQSSTTDDNVAKSTSIVVFEKKITDEKYLQTDTVHITYQLINDTIQVTAKLWKVDTFDVKFILEIQKKNKTEKIEGIAALIRLEDDGKFYLPEQSSILDENQNQDYTCDSTYSYNSKKIDIGFGFEQKNGKRLSLTISNSFLKVLPDQYYTLYRIHK